MGVALIVVLSGLGVAFSGAPTVPSASVSASSARTTAFAALEHSPAPVLPRVLPAMNSVGTEERALGSYVGLTSAQVAAAQSWRGSLTPAQLVLLQADARSHAAPTAAVLQSLGLDLTPASINTYCLVASTAAGAALGSFGGPIGALIGGIAGIVVGYYACQQAGVSDQVEQAFVSWAGAVMGGYGNEANLTAAEFQTIASALNVSAVGWERAADHAALTQLGNSSFNISLALFQSGVYANLAPVVSAYAYEVAGEYAPIITAVGGAGGPNDVYATVDPAVVDAVSGTACASYSTCDFPPGPASVAAYGAEMLSGTTENFIPHGVNVSVTCAAPCAASVPLYDQITHGWDNATVNVGSCLQITPSSSDLCGVGPFSGPTGMYSVGGTSLDLYVPGGQPTPVSASAGWTNGELVSATEGTTTAARTTPICSTGGAFSGCLGIVGGAVAASVPTTYPTYIYATVPGVVYSDLAGWITSIEWNAAINAETYWSFLRASGFHSVQSIPADCLVPAPYLVLPSSLNETDLNLTEWESMYLSALEGMGHFYNTTLSGTSFCGTQAQRQWSWGGSVWGNLFVNATGFVYLNNGTSPVNYAGQAMPTEKIGNHSTWAIGNTYYGDTWYNGSEQLLLMPTISTVSIPIGVRYEVPASNPIQIYAVQTGLDLWLNGNGTASGSVSAANTYRGIVDSAHPLGTLTAGDAIYLTSCQVGGVANGNCTVTVQTVNVTLVNITCPGPCKQPAPSGTFGGFPNPFSWLAGLFAGLFGGGPLGALLGSIAAALLILMVIAVIAYVAIVEVEAWGGKKRGGGGSGGGSTVVVTGGR